MESGSLGCKTDTAGSDDSGLYGDLEATAYRNDDVDDADIFAELGTLSASKEVSKSNAALSETRSRKQSINQNSDTLVHKLSNKCDVSKAVKKISTQINHFDLQISNVNQNERLEENQNTDQCNDNLIDGSSSGLDIGKRKRCSKSKRRSSTDTFCNKDKNGKKTSKGSNFFKEKAEEEEIRSNGCNTRSRKRTDSGREQTTDNQEIQKRVEKSERKSQNSQRKRETQKKSGVKVDSRVAKPANNDINFVMNCLTTRHINKKKEPVVPDSKAVEEGLVSFKKQEGDDQKEQPHQGPKKLCRSLSRTQNFLQDENSSSSKNQLRSASSSHAQKESVQVDVEMKCVNRRTPSATNTCVAKDSIADQLVSEGELSEGIKCSAPKFANNCSPEHEVHKAKQALDSEHCQDTASDPAEPFNIINKILGNRIEIGKNHLDKAQISGSATIEESRGKNQNTDDILKAFLCQNADPQSSPKKVKKVHNEGLPLRRSPRKLQSKAQSLDLYEDFLVSRTEEKESNEVAAVRSELAEVQVRLAESEKRCEALDEDNKTLLVNISSLWKTAINQIREKCIMISQLKREQESLIFRRAMRQVPRDDLNRVVDHIAAYDKEEFSQFMESFQREERECDCVKTNKLPPKTMTAKRIKESVVGSRVEDLSSCEARLLKMALGKQGEKFATACTNNGDSGSRNQGSSSNRMEHDSQRTPKEKYSSLDRYPGSTPRGKNGACGRLEYSTPEEKSKARDKSKCLSKTSYDRRSSRNLEENFGHRQYQSERIGEFSRTNSPSGREKSNRYVSSKLGKHRDEDSDHDRPRGNKHQWDDPNVDEEKGQGERRSRTKKENVRDRRKHHKDKHDCDLLVNEGKRKDKKRTRSRVDEKSLQEAYFNPYDETDHGKRKDSLKDSMQCHSQEIYPTSENRNPKETGNERKSNEKDNIFSTEKTSLEGEIHPEASKTNPENHRSFNSSQLTAKSRASHYNAMKEVLAEEALLSQSLFGKRMLAKQNMEKQSKGSQVSTVASEPHKVTQKPNEISKDNGSNISVVANKRIDQNANENNEKVVGMKEYFAERERGESSENNKKSEKMNRHTSYMKSKDGVSDKTQSLVEHEMENVHEKNGKAGVDVDHDLEISQNAGSVLNDNDEGKADEGCSVSKQNVEVTGQNSKSGDQEVNIELTDGAYRQSSEMEVLTCKKKTNSSHALERVINEVAPKHKKMANAKCLSSVKASYSKSNESQNPRELSISSEKCSTEDQNCHGFVSENCSIDVTKVNQTAIQHTTNSENRDSYPRDLISHSALGEYSISEKDTSSAETPSHKVTEITSNDETFTDEHQFTVCNVISLPANTISEKDLVTTNHCKQPRGSASVSKVMPEVDGEASHNDSTCEHVTQITSNDADHRPDGSSVTFNAGKELLEQEAAKSGSADIEILFENVVKRRAVTLRKSSEKSVTAPSKSSRELTVFEISEDEKALCPAFMKSIMETILSVTSEETEEYVDIEGLEEDEVQREVENEEGCFDVENSSNFDSNRAALTDNGKDDLEGETESNRTESIDKLPVLPLMDQLTREVEVTESRPLEDSRIEKVLVNDIGDRSFSNLESSYAAQQPPLSRCDGFDSVNKEHSHCEQGEQPEVEKENSSHDNLIRDVSKEKEGNGTHFVDHGREGVRVSENHTLSLKGKAIEDREISTTGDTQAKEATSHSSSGSYQDQWLYPPEEELLYDEGYEIDDVSEMGAKQGCRDTTDLHFSEGNSSKGPGRVSPKILPPIDVNSCIISDAKLEHGIIRSGEENSNNEISKKSREFHKESAGNRSVPKESVTVCKETENLQEAEHHLHKISKIKRATSVELPQRAEENQSPFICEENLRRDKKANDKSPLDRREKSPVRTRSSPLKESNSLAASSKVDSLKLLESSKHSKCDWSETNVSSEKEMENLADAKLAKLPRIKKLKKNSGDLLQMTEESYSPLYCEENLRREEKAKDKSHLKRRGRSPVRTRSSPLKKSDISTVDRECSPHRERLSGGSKSTSPEKLPSKSNFKDSNSLRLHSSLGSRSRSPENFPLEKQKTKSSHSRRSGRHSPTKNSRSWRRESSPRALRVQRQKTDRKGRQGINEQCDRKRKRRRSETPDERIHSLSSSRRREGCSPRTNRHDGSSNVRRLQVRSCQSRNEDIRRDRWEERRPRSPEEFNSNRRCSQRIRSRSRERKRYSPEGVKHSPKGGEHSPGGVKHSSEGIKQYSHQEESIKENKVERSSVDQNREEQKILTKKTDKEAKPKIVPVDRNLLISGLHLSVENCADHSEKEEGELEDDENCSHQSEKEEGELEDDENCSHQSEKEEGELEDEDVETAQMKSSDLSSNSKAATKEDRSSATSVKMKENVTEIEKENYTKIGRKDDVLSIHEEKEQTPNRKDPIYKGNKLGSTSKKKRFKIVAKSKGEVTAVTSSKPLKSILEEDTTICPSDLYHQDELPFVAAHANSSGSRASGSDDTIDMIVKTHNENCAQDDMNLSDDSEMSLLHFIGDNRSLKFKQDARASKNELYNIIRSHSAEEGVNESIQINQNNDVNTLEQRGIGTEVEDDSLSEAQYKNICNPKSIVPEGASMKNEDVKSKLVASKSSESSARKNISQLNESGNERESTNITEKHISLTRDKKDGNDCEQFDDQQPPPHSRIGKSNEDFSPNEKCKNTSTSEIHDMLCYSSQEYNETTNEVDSDTALLPLREQTVPLSPNTEAEDSDSSDSGSSCSGCSTCGNDDLDSSSSASSDSSSDSDSDSKDCISNTTDSNSMDCLNSLDHLFKDDINRSKGNEKSPKKTPIKHRINKQDTPHKSPHLNSHRTPRKTPCKTPKKTPCKKSRTPLKSVDAITSFSSGTEKSLTDKWSEKCISLTSSNSSQCESDMATNNKVKPVSTPYIMNTQSDDHSCERRTQLASSSSLAKGVLEKSLQSTSASVSTSLQKKKVVRRRARKVNLTATNLDSNVFSVVHETNRPTKVISSKPISPDQMIRSSSKELTLKPITPAKGLEMPLQKRKLSPSDPTEMPLQKRKLSPSDPTENVCSERKRMKLVALGLESPSKETSDRSKDNGKRDSLTKVEMKPPTKETSDKSTDNGKRDSLTKVEMKPPTKETSDRSTNNGKSDSFTKVEVKRRKVKRKLNLGLSSDSSRVTVMSVHSSHHVNTQKLSAITNSERHFVSQEENEPPRRSPRKK